MIKELILEEATRLRKLVKNRFLCGAFNGAGFKISQHKASYKPLADDINRVLPDSGASVTTHRLRKLFYYTDPELCASDKLEKPSFGDDFVQALFRYVESAPIKATTEYLEIIGPETPGPEKQQASVPSSKSFYLKWGLRITIILFLLLLAIVAWHWMSQPKYWTEEFNGVRVDSLKSRGWVILDYDSVAFSRQL